MKSKIHPIEQYSIDIVKKLRTTHNLTQADIADILGLRGSFIGNVENHNKPSKYNLKHINVLADYFNLSPKDFLPAEAYKQNATGANK